VSFADLPKIDEILRDPRIEIYRDKLPPAALLEMTRRAVHALREALSGGDGVLINADKDALYARAAEALARQAEDALKGRLRTVINATGVIIHTNLGRAPMSAGAISGLEDMLRGYANLEYDLEAGKRRSRTAYLEFLVKSLTGAEAAMFVNNNAAALLVIFNTLCEGRGVVLSRGEIVEIGDSFRVSDIIKKSGARIYEVGTTNRTSLTDYTDAIDGDTGAILKVHPSNFKITGYTESVPVKALAALAREKGVALVEDMGSGVLTDLRAYGLHGERQARDAVADGADLVTFSGDKLLGGPQAGIIAGRKDLIDRIKRNQLTRCLRLDKARIYLLENTLTAYFNREPDIPALQAVRMDTREKAQKLLDMLKAINGPLDFQLTECEAGFGGGAAPGETIKSCGVTVTGLPAAEIDKALRAAEPPVLATIWDNRVILDVMTVDEREFPSVARVFAGF
jgi:L-seryl-tRNA(Ser) seleniumtransferase